MDHNSVLCDLCSQIVFLSLGCPTRSELIRAIKALRNNERIPKFLPFREGFDQEQIEVPGQTTLGSLGRIQVSSATCPLCALFFDIIAREGKILLVPGWEECTVTAKISSCQGVITNSPTDVNGKADGSCFMLRRLSMNVKAADGGFQARFHHIAQPCKIGTMDSNDFSFTLPTPHNEMYFAGRKIPPTINMGWLRSWIQICDREHGKTCQLSSEQSGEFSMPLIRLLDVRNHCIQTFTNVNPAKIRYIALSYVWGGPQPLQLLKSNAKRLQGDGSLRKVVLPQTIADAIEVTCELDVNYIWIDALCIVQDDDNDKSEQIDSMSMIYRSATMTIIAACGADCNASLAGLRAGTRTFKQKEAVVIPPSENHPGMSLLSTCKSTRPPSLDFLNNREDGIDVSVWNSRGWTMQERMLSRRNLFFTEAQVVWACDGAVFCEESYFEHPQLDDESTHDRPASETPLRWGFWGDTPSPATLQSINAVALATPQDRENFWRIFRSLVTMLSIRSFTYDGDALDGFSGITDAIEQLSDQKFLWGHPVSEFALSLSWIFTSHGDPCRRTEKTTLPVTNLKRNTAFPSWSWLGWKGQVSLWVGSDRQLSVHHSETAEIEPFSHSMKPLQFRRVERKGEHDDQTMLSDLSRMSRQALKAPWKLYENTAVTAKDIVREIPELTEPRLLELPEESIIFFWASQACFCISLREREKNVEKTLDILNAAGESVGIVRKTETAQWNPAGSDCAPSCEFIAVGRRFIPETPHFPPKVLALQIVWEDSIAYRVSIAEIDERAWLDAKPQWRLIAMM